MKRFNTYLLVAAMAVSGTGLAAMAQNNDMNGMNSGTNSSTVNTAPENSVNNNAAGNNGAIESNRMQQIGGQQADESTQKDVRNMLTKVVDDAVKPDHFDNLSKHLAKGDRDRIGNYADKKQDDLNQAINQFRQDYKNKYNQDIDIDAKDLNSLMVYSGQDKKSATAELPNPDLSNHANYTNGGISSNSEQLNNSSANANNTAAGAGSSGAIADRNLHTPGNDVTVSNRSGVHSGADTTVATAGLPTGQASVDNNRNSTVHGNDVTANPGLATNNQVQSETNGNNALAAGTATGAGGTATGGMNNQGLSNDRGSALASAGGVTLNLINEGHLMNSWKIDVPNEISGQQLHDSLLRHIRMLDDQKATWPANPDQANRLVAFHVLQAFNDTSMASERY